MFTHNQAKKDPKGNRMENTLRTDVTKTYAGVSEGE
ncbi:hypothetical protein MGSAQ_000304 [marine sediment metagenome]|uniref:Uncharacterized protein n=1 Tax=marine sediment metagenome TaxID=412755 RepID=A0A1B6NXP3_9ZZZZ